MRMKMNEAETDKKWFAVITGFRREKYVLELLIRKKIVAYLPLIKRTRKYRSRIKSHDVPLLSCYVFVLIHDDERIKILETEYVKGFVKFDGKEAEIPPHEIAILKKVVGQYDDVQVIDKAVLENGDKVELLAGDLTGLTGRIIEKKGKRLFLVRFDRLDIDLSWTVSSSKLRKVI
jgi:transcription antitermination factor NusG